MGLDFSFEKEGLHLGVLQEVVQAGDKLPSVAAGLLEQVPRGWAGFEGLVGIKTRLAPN